MGVKVDKISGKPVLHDHDATDIYLSSGTPVETALISGAYPNMWDAAITNIRGESSTGLDSGDDIGDLATGNMYTWNPALNQPDDGVNYLMPTDKHISITVTGNACSIDVNTGAGYITYQGAGADPTAAAIDLCTTNVAGFQTNVNIVAVRVGTTITLTHLTPNSLIAIDSLVNITGNYASFVGRWSLTGQIVFTTLTQTLTNKTLGTGTVLISTASSGLMKLTLGIPSVATPGTDYIAGGQGLINQVPYFSAAGTLAASANFTWDGTSHSLIDTSAFSTTSGANLAIVSNNAALAAATNRLGGLQFWANTGIAGGVTNSEVASIIAVASGTWTEDTACATALVFKTRATVAGLLTEGMRLSSAGALGIGITPTTERLHTDYVLTNPQSSSDANTFTKTISGTTANVAQTQGTLKATITGTATTPAAQILAAAGHFYTSTVLTKNDMQLATSFSNVFGNASVVGFAYGTTTGLNIGGFMEALNGNVNVGYVGKAVTAKANTTNIGLVGVGKNTNGTAPIEVGVFAYLGTLDNPTMVSSALLADNGTSLNPIFTARDNGATVFAINDGGTVVTTSSIQTAAPTTGTAGAWKFGIKVDAAVVFDTTKYVQLDIGGTLYKVGLVT